MSCKNPFLCITGLFFLVSLPSASFAQKPWVPESLERRFHPEEGTPWFMKDGRPDSIDVLHYDVEVAKLDKEAGTLSGECRIEFRSLKEDIEKFRLDLAGFQVDWVLKDGEEIEYVRDAEKEELLLQFPAPLKKGERAEVKIAYEGEPVVDETGWGGTYFRNGYVFNLGVGFGAKPHSYGRTWFPCVDHFRERASYSFRVVAPEGEKAVCSGILRDTADVDEGKRWHWELEKEVPPYLVSFAVGEFSTLHWEYESVTGRKVPVRIDVPPGEREDAEGSFAHLDEAMVQYEKHFGPYRWPRVGYVAVPFPSGAMEHATNIAYPEASVNGTPNSDDLMSHELSHSWWGNLVTCGTPWDMWINEGMASFSEFLFFEGLDGKAGYREKVRENHKGVLLSAHLKDGRERRAVYGIPHRYTYGAHVYDKGADVVRTFRYLLGDSLFFGAMKHTLQEHAYENMATYRLGELWEEYSERPVEAYFEDWLLRPGHPHFSVKGLEKAKEGSYRIELEQRGTISSEPYRFIPLDLLFFGSDGQRITKTVRISEKEEKLSVPLPFEPVQVSLDPGGKLAQAQLIDTATVQKPVVRSFEHVDATLDLDTLDGPAFVDLRQHIISPELDDLEKAERKFSKERYWSIGGTFPSDSSNSVSFGFDGLQEKGVHPEAAFFAEMDKIDESELYVIRRPQGEDDWIRCASCSILEGESASDGKGRILVEGGKKGDFALVRPE